MASCRARHPGVWPQETFYPTAAVVFTCAPDQVALPPSAPPPLPLVQQSRAGVSRRGVLMCSQRPVVRARHCADAICRCWRAISSRWSSTHIALSC